MPHRLKKIAFLDYSPIFAGAERVLYNVIAHIDRSKYEPILVFPYPMEHQAHYDSLDCEKIYLSSSLSWWMGSDRWSHPLRGTDFIKRAEFGRRIAKIIKERNIDILDVNLVRGDVMMWVWATRKLTTAKIVGHYRSQDQNWVPSANAQRLFDVIACVSKFSKKRFQLKGEFTKSVVLYDSVDVDIMYSSKTKAEAKAAINYDADTILLTSVGQLSRHKGHDNAIIAFSKIADQFPKTRLLIAGGGLSENIQYYRQIAANHGVSDKVFIPGKQFSDIQTVYRASDLTLSLTKVGEGFGLVPYESALLGTPFIAPKFGAVCEFVSDLETGLLVDTNDLDAITGKIAFALENPSKMKEMTHKLQDTIHQQLHPKVLASNLDKLYSSLL